MLNANSRSLPRLLLSVALSAVMTATGADDTLDCTCEIETMDGEASCIAFEDEPCANVLTIAKLNVACDYDEETRYIGEMSFDVIKSSSFDYTLLAELTLKWGDGDDQKVACEGDRKGASLGVEGEKIDVWLCRLGNQNNPDPGVFIPSTGTFEMLARPSREGDKNDFIFEYPIQFNVFTYPRDDGNSSPREETYQWCNSKGHVQQDS